MVSDVRAAKAALRSRVLAGRAARAAADVTTAGEAVAGVASALPAARLVAAYAGVGTEPPTLPLLDRLAGAGASVLLPLLLPDSDLDWAAYTGPDELRTGRLGLREPVGPSLGRSVVTSADLVLVPALAVDRAGRRLGRGGGSFDRVLARVRADAVVIAVVYADEVLDEALPVEPHDRPVDAALTPSGLVRLRPTFSGDA